MQTVNDVNSLDTTKEHYHKCVGWKCQYCNGKTKIRSNYKLYNVPEGEFQGFNRVCLSCDASVSTIQGDGHNYGKGFVMTFEDRKLMLKAAKYSNHIIDRIARKRNISIKQSFGSWKDWISKELKIEPKFADLYIMNSEQLQKVIAISKPYLF